MLIQYKNIPCYYLSRPQDIQRQKNIECMLDSLNIKHTQIKSDTFNRNRHTSIAYDTIKLINCAIQNDVFPFLWMEDDATLIDTIPDSIYINNEADLIYLGSTLHNHNRSLKLENILKLKIEDYDSNYYRLINSLSCHAIIVPSLQSALLTKNMLYETIEQNIPHDVTLGIRSRKHLFLTPKDGPFFYQNDVHNKIITNFKWKNIKFI